MMTCLKSLIIKGIIYFISFSLISGKYLPKKRKFSENNVCRKLIKYCKLYISSDYFVNKYSRTKKVVPDFRHGENIHCDKEIFPTLNQNG